MADRVLFEANTRDIDAWKTASAARELARAATQIASSTATQIASSIATSTPTGARTIDFRGLSSENAFGIFVAAFQIIWFLMRLSWEWFWWKTRGFWYWIFLPLFLVWVIYRLLWMFAKQEREGPAEDKLQEVLDSMRRDALRTLRISKQYVRDKLTLFDNHVYRVIYHVLAWWLAYAVGFAAILLVIAEVKRYYPSDTKFNFEYPEWMTRQRNEEGSNAFSDSSLPTKEVNPTYNNYLPGSVESSMRDKDISVYLNPTPSTAAAGSSITAESTTYGYLAKHLDEMSKVRQSRSNSERSRAAAASSVTAESGDEFGEYLDISSPTTTAAKPYFLANFFDYLRRPEQSLTISKPTYIITRTPIARTATYYNLAGELAESTWPMKESSETEHITEVHQPHTLETEDIPKSTWTTGKWSETEYITEVQQPQTLETGDIPESTWTTDKWSETEHITEVQQQPQTLESVTESSDKSWFFGWMKFTPKEKDTDNPVEKGEITTTGILYEDESTITSSTSTTVTRTEHGPTPIIDTTTITSSFEKITLEPVTLEPVTLKPVTLDPITLEPITLEASTIFATTTVTSVVGAHGAESPPFPDELEEDGIVLMKRNIGTALGYCKRCGQVHCCDIYE